MNGRPETKKERQVRLAAEANAHTEPRDICNECWEADGHHPLCRHYTPAEVIQPLAGQESLL